MIDQNPFYQSKHALVRWDPELEAVYTVADGYLDDQEYMHWMKMILELAAEKGAQRWLSNGLKSRPLSSPMQAWTQELWLPLAKKIAFLKVAILMPESLLTKLSLQRTFEEAMLKTGMETRFFSDPGTARTWLIQG